MKTIHAILIIVIPITALILFMFQVTNIIELQNVLDEAQNDHDTTRGDVLTSGPTSHQECLDRLITNLSECENAIRYSKEETK